MNAYIDYSQFVTEFLPNYWQKEEVINKFSMNKVMAPFYLYLYYREQMIVCSEKDENDRHYGINNLLNTVTAIANGTFPNLPIPSWESDLFNQNNYELSILLFVGNIVNLLPFKVAIPNIFTLSDPVRDILSSDTFVSSYPLGSGTSADFNLIDITNQQYANYLLARVAKFYGNPSINAILYTISKVSQRPLSDISLEIDVPNVKITINNIPGEDYNFLQSLLEFRDKYGEPLYMEPSYGQMEFTLNYV